MEGEPFSCPFYGHYMYLRPNHQVSTPFLLLNSRGNQCALVLEAFAPCHMEINHLPVDWRDCPVVTDIFVEKPRE